MLAWFSRKVDLYAVLDAWSDAGTTFEPGRPIGGSWYVDRYEVALGEDDDHALFDRAVKRLFRYDFYPRSFLTVAANFLGEERPPGAGERIVQRIRVIPGIVDAITMNIVESVWQEPDRKGFTLVTSERQYEIGEWTASIVRSPGRDTSLRVNVISKPSQRLPAPARLFARGLQKHAQKLAMKKFCNAIRDG